MGSVLAHVDAVAAGPCGPTLAALVANASDVDGTPVRCPVTDPDAEALQRLDLALRMLPGQPVSQWCREAGEGTAVVRSWPLPARSVALHGRDGAVLGMLLVTGRPQGDADVWRFRLDDTRPSTVLDRARRLLAT